MTPLARNPVRVLELAQVSLSDRLDEPGAGGDRLAGDDARQGRPPPGDLTVKRPDHAAERPLASERVIDRLSKQDYRLALSGSLLYVLRVKLAVAKDAAHREDADEQSGADQPPVIGDPPHT